jgi:transposase-like protein
MTNPPCPKCHSAHTGPKGATTTGNQRYRCWDCQHSWTPSPAKRGRPLLGDAPLTPAEKMRRARAKKKQADT